MFVLILRAQNNLTPFFFYLPFTGNKYLSADMSFLH